MKPDSGLEVKFRFHPRFHVSSMEESEEFFARVFGEPRRPLRIADSHWPGGCGYTSVGEPTRLDGGSRQAAGGDVCGYVVTAQ